jgi:DGQHR domain-containing protein
MEKRRYFGCRLKQRIASDTIPFFIFQGLAKDIKQWVGIQRIQEVKKGTQRVLRPSRVQAVTQFLKADSINTIPNSIILAFKEDTIKFISLDNKLNECDLVSQFNDIEGIDLHNNCQDKLAWGAIEFSFDPEQPEHLRPALIVDGQHRLYGMSAFDEENLPISIISLIDATPQEQAFQFIVVNNKAVRVSADNVKSIVADFDETKLEERLSRVRVKYGDAPLTLRYINDSPSSPFQNLLNWPYNKAAQEEDKLVPITAIEQALRYARTLFVSLEEDEDSLIEFFCAVWRPVKGNYPELFGKNDKFMTKANINALNEYITDRLKFFWELDMLDIFLIDEVENKVLDILRRLPGEFWSEKWRLKIQDNASFRKLIKDDLDKLVDNFKLQRSWYEDLNLPQINEEPDLG